MGQGRLVPWHWVSGAFLSLLPQAPDPQGAADLTSRDVSVLDTHNQAQEDGEAFDFFEQQDRAEPEALPIPGQKGEEAGKSSEEEEEEALDPLGIMR